MMPGIDGFALAEIINEKWPQVPVIFLSAWCGSDYEETGLHHVRFLTKPVSLQQIEYSIWTVLTDMNNDGLLSYTKKSYRNGVFIYRVLSKCRTLVSNIVSTYQDDDLFESAIRHKVKEVVINYCNAISNTKQEIDLTNHLLLKIEKLSNVIDRIKHGSEYGLRKIVKAVEEDVQFERPMIKVLVSSIPRIPKKLADSGVETFLSFCILEFVDNALAAIQDEGHIEIKLRKMKTRKVIALCVRNSGSEIPEEIFPDILEEGVSTNGKGRGIGLAIIKQLADRFNAYIEVSQNPEVQFLVTIPIS